MYECETCGPVEAHPVGLNEVRMVCTKCGVTVSEEIIELDKPVEEEEE